MKRAKNIKIIAVVLGAIYGFFFLLFALDSFESGFTLKSLLAFLIHSIPAFLILGTTAAGYKWPLASSLIFLIFFILTMWFFRSYGEILNFLIVSLPALLTANLLFIAYRLQKFAATDKDDRDLS